MARKAGDLGQNVHQDVRPLAGRVDRHIAQTLAGQAQRLGEREAGQGVGVECRRVRHGLAVKNDVPVRLVADEEDVVAVLLALGGQDLGQPGQGLRRVNHARGVVGGVDEDAGDILGQHLLKGVQIGLERGRLGRHHFQHGTRSPDVGPVLRKIGCERQHLVAGLGHGADGVGNGARGTRGGENMLLLIGQAERFGQMGCRGGAEPRVALAGAVAVEGNGLLRGQQVLHGRRKPRRAGHAGVAQRVVKHVLIADLGSPLFAVHKGLTDHALMGQHRAVGFVQHNHSPLAFRISFISCPAVQTHSSALP